MAVRLLMRSVLNHPPNPTAIRSFLNVRHFASHSIAVNSQEFVSSEDLVNDLSRILSDHRSPRHDIESALTPFAAKLSSDVVEQVLKRCKNLGFSAHRFFLWAQNIPGFHHSKESHHILLDILGSSRQFPFLWDFLLGMRRDSSCEITREIFWIVFRAYSRADLPTDAIRAFNKMGDFGIKPSVDDFDQLLYTLCKRKHVRHAQEFFDRIKLDDLNPTVKSYSILIKGWGDINESGEAQKLFDEMLERGYALDLLSWNSVLDALCRDRKLDKAYEFFQRMRIMGPQPDAYSYSVFIHAYCDANDLHSAFRVLDSMERYSLVPNVFTFNCIVKNLCKNDKVDDAYGLLAEMMRRGVRPDTWTYNTILAFHCDHNEVNRALKLISMMDRDSCELDRHTYNMVLKMLIRIGRFDRVEKVWFSMEGRGFYPTASTYAVMIRGLCKKRGKLEEACKYFEMMVDEGIPPYDTTCEMLRNKLIGFGFAERVHILADKMERSTSLSIQEAAKTMRRGNRSQAIQRSNEEFSDESDSSELNRGNN